MTPPRLARLAGILNNGRQRPRHDRLRLHAPLLLMLAMAGNCAAAEDIAGGEPALEPNDIAQAQREITLTQTQSHTQNQPPAPIQTQTPAARPRIPAAGLPGDDDTVRAEVFDLATGGAAPEALEAAQARPDIFSPVDLASVEELAIRQQVRGGRDKARAMTSPDRFDGIDTALRAADDLTARLPDTPEYATVRSALAGDRTIAYAARGDMAKAVSEFESIPPGAPVSIDALAGAGDAYSYLNQPEQSGVVYRRAIAQSTAAGADQATRGFQYGSRTRLIDLREGLFWAMLDQGRYADAKTVLDEMGAALPPADQIKVWEPANDDYLRVYRLRAQYLISTGRDDEGMAALQKLEQEVPFNVEVRDARADATLSEAHPRQAIDMYSAALTDHPDSVETLGGLGRAELATGQYASARAVNDAFGNTFPESASVKNFRRDFNAYESPVFTTELGFEHGNSTLASDEFTSDSYLYSQPFADYWRVFAHTFYGRASTDSGNISRTQTGVGGDFRRGPLSILGEATRTLGGDGRTGGRGTIAYSFNDYLSASAGITSDDNTLPWKAYVAHVWGRTATASITYRASDRREVDATVAASRYSDGNFHNEASVGGTQRLWTTGNQQIDMSVRAGTSGNTAENTIYFNPARDYAVEATATHQWTAWKSGEMALQQRIALSGGAYNERGFGTSGFWGARVEHAWTFRKDITLTYGVGVSRHAYDGKQELSETGYLALSVPF